MPLYEYKCAACGHEFEELKSKPEGSETTPCKQCGADAPKKISQFSAVIAGGSPTETLDMTVGREADKRWKMYGDRQSKRRKGQEPQVMTDLPKTKDGKFMPVMGLGNEKERGTRTEYSTALQGHLQTLAKRGQPQVEGPGAF